MDDKIISYLRTWPTNIGNDFIDIGGITSIKKANPNAKLYDFGGLGRRYFMEYKPNTYVKLYSNFSHFISYLKGLYTKNREINYKQFKNIVMMENNVLSNFFDISSVLKSNYVVLSGCVLTYQIGLFYSILTKLHNNNVKIILYGVGGSKYDESEITFIKEFLKSIKPYALVSRDKKTYDCYGDLCEHSYNGIDAAFFIPDYFTPPKLDIDNYIVFNFDKINEPKIISNHKLIIRTSHCVSPLNSMKLSNIYNKKNILVSNNAKDYFTTYSNAEEVHSDRVHACVASLIYEKPCKLYYKTKRALLFDRIGVNDIIKNLTKIDISYINKEKTNQINFLKEIMN